MQPYFFPYIGYWQLIKASDVFVVYDNIKFTKKGWIQRNRILNNEKDFLISLSIKNDSDHLDIRDRFLVEDFDKKAKKIYDEISCFYKRAPFFNETLSVIQKTLFFQDRNLFSFLLNSIKEVLFYLNIDTKLAVSSTLEINHKLKNKDKVIAICKFLDSSEYINLSGGKDLYCQKEFRDVGIKLEFMKNKNVKYNQFSKEFVPNLSIIDAMMFNSVEDINKMLDEYVLE